MAEEVRLPPPAVVGSAVPLDAVAVPFPAVAAAVVAAREEEEEEAEAAALEAEATTLEAEETALDTEEEETALAAEEAALEIADDAEGATDADAEAAGALTETPAAAQNWVPNAAAAKRGLGSVSEPRWWNIHLSVSVCAVHRYHDEEDRRERVFGNEKRGEGTNFKTY